MEHLWKNPAWSTLVVAATTSSLSFSLKVNKTTGHVTEKPKRAELLCPGEFPVTENKLSVTVSADTRDCFHYLSLKTATHLKTIHLLLVLDYLESLWMSCYYRDDNVLERKHKYFIYSWLYCQSRGYWKLVFISIIVVIIVFRFLIM